MIATTGEDGMNGIRLSWTGVLSIVVLALVIVYGFLVRLKVPGFRNLDVAWIGFGVVALFGLAQYVQWSVRERNHVDEAQRLKSRPGPDPRRLAAPRSRAHRPPATDAGRSRFP